MHSNLSRDMLNHELPSLSPVSIVDYSSQETSNNVLPSLSLFYQQMKNAISTFLACFEFWNGPFNLPYPVFAKKKGKIATQKFLRKLQTLFFLPSLYFISKCKDAIPSWPVLNFEMFVSSFTLCLLLILSSILFNTDHTVTFYQIILIQTWIKFLENHHKRWWV